MSAGISSLLDTFSISPTLTSRHWVSMKVPLSSMTWQGELLIWRSEMWRFMSSKPSLVIVRISTITKGPSVDQGSSGESKRLVYDPISISIDMNRKYIFASRLNWPKRALGMNDNNEYRPVLMVFAAKTVSSIFSS